MSATHASDTKHDFGRASKAMPSVTNGLTDRFHLKCTFLAVNPLVISTPPVATGRLIYCSFFNRDTNDVVAVTDVNASLDNLLTDANQTTP